MTRASLLGCIGLLGLAAGCAPVVYVPPTAAQPHAVVKFRRVYQARPGPSLHEELRIDGHIAWQQGSDARPAPDIRHDALLVHPRPGEFVVESIFSHTETRTEEESYTDTESYDETESYPCGEDTCTRSVTHTRPVTKWRTVTKDIDVVDAHCSRGMQLAPVKDGVYMIELEQQDSSSCHVACYEQHETGQGRFSNRPCPAPMVIRR